MISFLEKFLHKALIISCSVESLKSISLLAGRIAFGKPSVTSNRLK
jgi:hypothetical protein